MKIVHVVDYFQPKLGYQEVFLAKEQAKLIFKELGITMGDAFNMFLSQVNLHQGMPFEIKIPNDITKKVIKEARQGKNVEDFSLDELNG